MSGVPMRRRGLFFMKSMVVFLTWIQYTTSFTIKPLPTTKRTKWLAKKWMDRFCSNSFTCNKDLGRRAAHYLSATKQKNLWSIDECLDAFNGNNVSLRNRIHFIDGSWYHKGNRNGRKEFEDGPRIPNALYLDMDDIAMSRELYPTMNPKGLRVMFPPKELFAATMDAMKISNDDQVIVYARSGCLFAPRTWFLFRTFGHQRVGLMQGSLEDWMDRGGPVDTHARSYDLWARDLVDVKLPTKYQIPENSKENFVDMDFVVQAIEQQQQVHEGSISWTLIIDTRGSSFSKGHMPGAVHIPYTSLVEPENELVLKQTSELLEILKSKGVVDALDDKGGTSKVLLTCGSAVSVCHMALVLEECGYCRSGPPLIYDGSWNEYGSDPTTPKVTND